MKVTTRRWIFTGVIFLISFVLTVLIGIAIEHMTITKHASSASSTEAADGSDDSAASSEAESESTDAAETTAAEVTSPIRELTADELQEIEDTYDGTVLTYSIGAELDESMRPVNCLKYYETFSALSPSITVFSSDHPDSKQVAISFVLTQEYENNTAYILNKLNEKGVKATFFVSQTYAEENPDIIQRIIYEGHTLGSVGSTAPDAGLATLSLEDQMEDMLTFQRYIEDTYSYSMTCFYFRCDAYSYASLKMATEMGYHVCYYTMEYNDGDASASIDSDTMLQDLEGKMHFSASLLLHNANAATLIILPNLINWLGEQGYEIVSFH